MGYTYLTFFMLLFICGFLSFIFFHFHYLHLLLSLEIMMISLYFVFSLFFYFGLGGLSSLILFLVGFICESTFGISLLLSYIFLSGVELFTLLL